jgi:hypothetical protein
MEWQNNQYNRKHQILYYFLFVVCKQASSDKHAREENIQLQNYHAWRPETLKVIRRCQPHKGTQAHCYTSKKKPSKKHHSQN